MGCYINPPNESKESFLAREGRVISVNEAKIADGEYPVCLVDNGMFTAALVAFNTRELAVVTDVRDVRPKVFYMVPRAKLLDVSDIIDYVDAAEFVK